MICRKCGAQVPAGARFCAKCGTSLRTPEEEELSAVWPEWKLVEKIGEGPCETVYRAKREESGKVFSSAIRIIRVPKDFAGAKSSPAAQTADLKASVEKCVNDIKKVAALRGGNNTLGIGACAVKANASATAWTIYIRTEYLQSLADLLAEKELSEADVIKLGIDISNALESCAKRNVIHGDIKPENIFLSRSGNFKLGNFGIVRSLEKGMGVSRRETSAYIAPEVYRGETDGDEKSDIYSLGILLYQLLNRNRLPFFSGDVRQAVERRMRGEALPKPQNASEKLAGALLVACAPTPAKRFASATALKNVLTILQKSPPAPSLLPEGPTTTLLAEEEPSRFPKGSTTTLLTEEEPPHFPEGPTTTLLAEEEPPPPIRARRETQDFQEPPRPPKKRMATWIKVLICVLAVLLLLEGIGGILVYRWYTSPQQEILRVVSAGNYDRALEILDEDRMASQSDELSDMLHERIGSIQVGFLNGEIEYAAAWDELSSIEKMKIFAVSGEVKDVLSLVERVNESRTHFDTAESLAAAGKYAEAMEEYPKVIEDDPNYEDAQRKLVETIDKIREQALADAATSAETGDYIGAIAILDDALNTLPDDEKLIERRKAYENGAVIQERNSILEVAKADAENGDYLKAMETVKEVMASFGSDEELTALYDRYCNQYVTQMIAEADERVSKWLLDGALDILNEALSNVPGNTLLINKFEQVHSLKVAPLSTLTPTSGWFSWNVGYPVDSFGRSYTGCDYVVIEGVSYDDFEFAEYFVGGKYTKLTGTIVPHASMSQEAWCQVGVYANDELVYISPGIDSETETIKFEVDIRGADYVTIAMVSFVCEGDQNSAVILYDVKLKYD